MADIITDKPLVSIVDEDFKTILILPEPSSYTATTSTLVDSARNSKGVVKGAVIQPDLAKIELEWKYLTAEEWATILNVFKKEENFYNYVRFYNQDIQDWEVRRMYVNDRKTSMWRRDPDTHDVMGWTSCKLSLIDTGEGVFEPYDFATDSWEKINKVAESGNAEKYYSVGDTKTFKLTTNEEITIRIVGFNHDDLVSGGKASISIEMVDLLSDTFVYNSSNTNEGGWEASPLRSTLNSDVFATLPTDLQAVIKSVKKKTSTGYGATGVVDSEDKLWVVSMAEVYSETAIKNCSYSYISNYVDIYTQEGSQYEFYKNLIGDQDPRTACQDLQKKRNGSNYYWWLRSPSLHTSRSVWCFGNGYAYIAYSGATDSYGVALGFCI